MWMRQAMRRSLADSDAVVIAMGQGKSGIGAWGLPMHPKGVEADGNTYQVEGSNVFVVGSA